MVHESCSFLDDRSLLPDAQLLKVVEADSEPQIVVVGLVASGVHVEPCFVLVPEDLVRLVFHGQLNYVNLLLQSLHRGAPTRLSRFQVGNLAGNAGLGIKQLVRRLGRPLSFVQRRHLTDALSVIQGPVKVSHLRLISLKRVEGFGAFSELVVEDLGGGSKGLDFLHTRQFPLIVHRLGLKFQLGLLGLERAQVLPGNSPRVVELIFERRKTVSEGRLMPGGLHVLPHCQLGVVRHSKH